MPLSSIRARLRLLRTLPAPDSIRATSSRRHTVLVIDGAALDVALSPTAPVKLASTLRRVALGVDGVLACRCTPVQKAALVRLHERLAPLMVLRGVLLLQLWVMVATTSPCFKLLMLEWGSTGREGGQAARCRRLRTRTVQPPVAALPCPWSLCALPHSAP